MSIHPISGNPLYFSASPKMHTHLKPATTRKIHTGNICVHASEKHTHTHTHTHLTYPWPLLSWLKLHWVKSEREDSDINSRYKTKALSPQPQQFVIFSINTLQGNSSSRFFLSLLIFLWEKITSAWSWRWLVNDGLTRTINITSQQNPLKE